MESVDNQQFDPIAPMMRQRHDKSVTTPAGGQSLDIPTNGALHALQILKGASLSRVLVGHIETMILDEEFAPGDHVNELVLSRRFGVSRGPLREALGTLTARGLLVQVKNRGTFVRQVGVAEAAEIYVLREILELAAVDHISACAVDLREALLAQFRRLLEEMRIVVGDNDSAQYYLLNVAFHELVISASGNQKMLDTYRALVRELALFRRRNLRSAASLASSFDEHVHIVEALERADFSEVRQQISFHIDKGRHRVFHPKA